MGNGEQPSSNAASAAPEEEKKTDEPIYSREVTLQAHFTFGTPSMAPVQYAHVTPTSTSSLSGRPLMASGCPLEHWRWCGGSSGSGSGSGGAQCSITCGREGLTMTYNQGGPNAALPPPCTICGALASTRPGRPTSPHLTLTTMASHEDATRTTTTTFSNLFSSPAVTRSMVNLSHPHQDQPPVTSRSLTFSGSLDRATQRPLQQRPYGRRCKSTAHIILQHNDTKMPAGAEHRPHEFHATRRDDDLSRLRQDPAAEGVRSRVGDHQGGTEGRGRARHRVGRDGHRHHTGVGGEGGVGGSDGMPPSREGWERLHPLSEEQEGARHGFLAPAVPPIPSLPPPCCPCHHCTALYSLVSSWAHDRTCHPCAHHHHHHHHQTCALASSQHAPLHHAYPVPRPDAHRSTGDTLPTAPHSAEDARGPSTRTTTETVRPPTKSPTLRTFNSHRCYEDEQPGARRPEEGQGDAAETVQHLRPDLPSQGKHRTPSPRVAPARPTSPASPPRSPSPELRGEAGVGREDRHPHPTPHLPRRVPRMGAAAAVAASAAAAAAAASSTTGPTYSAVQADGEPPVSSRDRATRTRLRPRPRTIHIDVYCSSSSDIDSSSPTSPISEDSLELGPRRPHAVVALGSKQRRKTELNLGRHHEHSLEERASSFVYTRSRGRHVQDGQRSAFITDDVLPLSSSPPTAVEKDEIDLVERKPSMSSSTATSHSQNTTLATSHPSSIPMPAPPMQRPTTLSLPTSPMPESSENSGVPPRSRHSSLSYLSSPADAEPWEAEQELPSSALSWRGSEFETSTPRLTSDVDIPSPRSPRPTSGLSLSFLQEAFGEGETDISEMKTATSLHESPKQWRSPQLERQRYIQKGQETRYREAVIRRTQQDVERSQTATPTSVLELAKLPAFKEFSKEELIVISKSLKRRESQMSSEREDSLRLPEQAESFRPTERKDSNRLLEWMQQYKAQEKKESVKSPDFRGSDLSGYTESSKSLERESSYGAAERSESFGAKERRLVTTRDITNGDAHKKSSPVKLEKSDSIKSQELRELLGYLESKEATSPLERRDSGRSRGRIGYSSHFEQKESSRLLERRDSFKSKDKKEYYQSLEKKRELERKDSSCSVELTESDIYTAEQEIGECRRISGKSPERERKDLSKHRATSESGEYLEKEEFIEPVVRDAPISSAEERLTKEAVEHRDSRRSLERRESLKRSSDKTSSDSPDRKLSSDFEKLLEREESSRSNSIEWQDVVSTVRRRLSARVQQGTSSEQVRSPECEAAAVLPGSVQTPPPSIPEVSSPLPKRHSVKRSDSLHSHHEEEREYSSRIVGGRLINVGLFRQLPRFPFSQTVPVPASRLIEARTTYGPEQRKFVRPQLFGEMILSYPKRRGIHFGPPRNPQCSCENCRCWTELPMGSQFVGGRLRAAWSMTDLGEESSGTDVMLPHQAGSYPGASLSRNSSNASDSATHCHVGSAAAGRKQQ